MNRYVAVLSDSWGNAVDCNLNVSVCPRGQVLQFFLTGGVTVVTVI